MDAVDKFLVFGALLALGYLTCYAPLVLWSYADTPEKFRHKWELAPGPLLVAVGTGLYLVATVCFLVVT